MAFGRINVKSILEKSDYEKNDLINSFLSAEINSLKKEINLNAPVYFAVEAEKEGKGARSFFFLNMLDKDALKEDMEGGKGFSIKTVDGIDYSYDGDVVIGMRGDMVLIAVEPGVADPAKLIKEAFKFTEGKIADKKMISRIDAPGDIMVNINFEGLADAPAMRGQYSKEDLKDATAQIRVNFEKGRMVIAGSTSFPEKMRNKMNVSKADKPLIAKKLNDEVSGETLAAMQFSMDLPGIGMLLSNNMFIDEAFAEMERKLSLFGAELKISDLTPEDGVRMPNSGNKLGKKWMEMFIDIDAVANSIQIPMGGEALDELDFITYEVSENEATIIIQTHRANENFLATALDVASSFAMLMMGQISI